jgi:two-component system NtrC family sensor kinase
MGAYNSWDPIKTNAEVMMEEKSYKKLQWKIVATTLSFSLIPLFALGFSIYYQFSVSYTAKIIEMLGNRADNRRDAIDLFLDERVSQLYTLAYTHGFDQLKEESYLNRVFTLMQMRSKSYVDVGVIDRTGYYASYVGPYDLKGVKYAEEEWFHEVLLRGFYISDVFTGFRKFPHFIIAVMRREGDRSWILRATIDTEIFDSMVKAAQVGQKGDAFVLNKEGILQTPPRFDGGLLEKLDYLRVSKFTGTRIEEMNVKGEDNLYAMTWLRNKDWMLVIKESPREELMPLLRARLLVIGLGFGGILVIVMGAVFITRTMILRLITADRERATLDAGLMQSSKMAALGKLAAGIAHEVNNPLAVIKEKVGWLTDLLSEEDISKSENFLEFDDALRKIDSHVDRARKVTHRLLGFARRMEPSQERVNINKVLEETIEFLRNEAHYRNIKIHSDYAAHLPETTSDSAQLQQVFLNILNNAIDAVAKDGVISVQTTHYVRDRKVGICITDEGPGIPAEVLGKIFDPFFTTKEVGKGTGLGLAISYSIVEKLGGNIVVNSEVGRGTTFTIMLPVVNQDQFSK